MLKHPAAEAGEVVEQSGHEGAVIFVAMATQIQ